MTKFWDDKNQKEKAFRYCERNDLDYNDPIVQDVLRSYYRFKEGRYTDESTFFNEEHIGVEAKQGKIVRREPKTIYDILDNTLDPALKKKLELAFRNDYDISQLTPDGDLVPFDPTIKPPPTGFVSDLSDEEWIIRYIPRTIHGSLYNTQKIMLDFMNTHPRSLIEIFRSAGKTVITNAKIVRMICDNPNLRCFILSEEYSKVVQRVRMIRNLLVTPEIVADYGYLLNDSPSSRTRGKNTEYMFECHRQISAIEPTLMGITWKDTKSLGYHFDLGLLDDPWSNAAQNTTNALDTFKRFWAEFQGSLETCKWLFVLGTRKGIDDIYDYLEKVIGTFDVLTVPLVRKFPDSIQLLTDEFGKFIGAKIEGEYEITDTCKGKYSMTIEDPEKGIRCIPLLRASEPYYFEMEFQQHPYLPSGDVFKWDNICLYDANTTDPIENDFMRMFDKAAKVLIMDMAYGDSEFADYNALLLVAKFKSHLFLVDAWIGRWDFNQRIKTIRIAQNKYPDATLYIESDYFQLSMIKQIRGYFPRTREFKSATVKQLYKDIYDKKGYGRRAGKLGKIHDGLEHIINNRLLHIPKSLPNLEMIQLQITRFPKVEKIDFLDALAMGALVLEKRGANAFDKLGAVAKDLVADWFD